MVRHNNTIPNGHFHKKWQRHVKVDFKQPFRKRRRLQQRAKKAALCAPRPVGGPLRPIVRCPTLRYKLKVRAGRGFSLDELRGAGLNKRMVMRVGIAVDNRRRNQSVESLQTNVQRLKTYMANLIVLPLKERKRQDITKMKLIHRFGKPHQTEVKPIARLPTKEEKTFQAFTTLRKARADVRFLGKRLKKKNADGNWEESKKNTKKRGVETSDND